MPKVLIVANCPSENTKVLQQAVLRGCQNDCFRETSIRCKEAWDTDEKDVLWCDGIIVGTTENFGYMSGAIKDFFERIYYPCLEKTEGKPVALYVKGGLDGQGARSSTEKIMTGLRWKTIQPALVLKGDFRLEFAQQCEELGMTMAAGLEAGIY